MASRAAAALAALPAEQQEVFRLVRECGLSYEEVASVMDVPLRVVAYQMSQALSSLRAALAADPRMSGGPTPRIKASWGPPQ